MFSEEELKQRLYVNNYEQWTKLANRKFLSERKLNVTEIDNGIILPAKFVGESVSKGGVFDSNMNFVAGFFRNNPPNAGMFGVCGAYEVDKIVKSNNEVIFGGLLMGLFGHFILECLGRMWYILNNREDKRKIVFLITAGEKEWFKPFFELLDIDWNRIEILKKPKQYKKIIIPDESVHSWFDYTKEYLMPYDYIKSKVKEGSIKKLYLTRSKIKITERNQGMYLCNEEYFEQFYKNKGFTIISPEEFSIKEQISMLSGADEIVSTLGSLSHFAIFCKPGTKFTMLTRVDNNTLCPQCLINEARNIDWYIVDASLNFLPLQNRSCGVCLLGETKHWKKYVKEKYGEEIQQEYWPYKLEDFIKSWCFYLSIDSAAPLLMKAIVRTYEITKQNEVQPDVSELQHKIDLLESQLKSADNN